jgi:hypothetical protein
MKYLNLAYRKGIRQSKRLSSQVQRRIILKFKFDSDISVSWQFCLRIFFSDYETNKILHDDYFFFFKFCMLNMTDHMRAVDILTVSTLSLFYSVNYVWKYILAFINQIIPLCHTHQLNASSRTSLIQPKI